MNSRDIAKSLLKEKDSIQDWDVFLGEFVETLQSKNLGYKLPFILKHLEHESEKLGHENTLYVQYGVSPNDETRKKLQEIVEADEKVEVVEEIDEELIGGFIAEYKGKIYDGSIRSYLRNLKATLREF